MKKPIMALFVCISFAAFLSFTHKNYDGGKNPKGSHKVSMAKKPACGCGVAVAPTSVSLTYNSDGTITVTWSTGTGDYWNVGGYSNCTPPGFEYYCLTTRSCTFHHCGTGNLRITAICSCGGSCSSPCSTALSGPFPF